LDLDGTIIGDCTYQCDIYNIENTMKKNSIKIKSPNILIKCYKKKSKLIRPYFLYFLKKMKKMFHNSLFFIYTASDKEWAYKEIQLIEKTHEIKFDRPIFTRDDCLLGSDNNYKKSIKKILPKIVRKIKIKNFTNINDNIFIIDNNSVYIDYVDNLLICPTYNYKLFNNLWEIIPKESLKVKDVHTIIKDLINLNKLCSICHHFDNNMQQLELIYAWLYNKHKVINKNNKKYENDNFWKKITNLIIKNDINIFNKKSVRFLQKNI
jgi:hypothetical protein